MSATMRQKPDIECAAENWCSACDYEPSCKYARTDPSSCIGRCATAEELADFCLNSGCTCEEEGREG